MSKIYPSDLTDEQWAVLAPLILPSQGGRPRRIALRPVVNGLFYRNRTGCQQRMLPKEFGPWETVYYYFAKGSRDGTWRRLNDTLRERLRLQTLQPSTQQPRQATPGAGSMDSQTVKSTEAGGAGAGPFDGLGGFGRPIGGSVARLQSGRSKAGVPVRRTSGSES